MLFRIANREDPDQTASLFEILEHLPYHDTESSSLIGTIITLVNGYIDLVVFTHIAGTSETGSGRYLC